MGCFKNSTLTHLVYMRPQMESLLPDLYQKPHSVQSCSWRVVLPDEFWVGKSKMRHLVDVLENTFILYDTLDGYGDEAVVSLEDEHMRLISDSKIMFPKKNNFHR
ncbi:hypothetical protein E3N88_30046 [Mikania micrantha]|uniref:Uncharacterized protein n=1 Tax=Mikania micrantha TaxID=192012 RepID=A0A5N6MKY4_9ASTR|nr:hypothetical protein E3N88_30046 [Mikania micrantha]